MGLIDDNGVIAAQEATSLGLHEQHAVRHQLDIGMETRLFIETDLVGDGLANLFAQFFGNALGDSNRGHPPGPDVLPIFFAESRAFVPCRPYFITKKVLSMIYAPDLETYQKTRITTPE